MNRTYYHTCSYTATVLTDDSNCISEKCSHVFYIFTSYFSDKYHELCPANKFKAIFDTMTNNKPEVRLSDGDGSAALVRYHSNSTAGRKIGACEFNVKVDNPHSSKGIFVSIRKLKLRENTYGSYGGDQSCKDFLRFTYKNGTRTREICGNIETTVHNNLIRNFFDEISGELKVEISIDSSFGSANDYSGLEVDLVFTAYSSKFFSNLLINVGFHCVIAGRVLKP